MARILLIDDEEALLKLTGVVLGRHGYDVVLCASGGQGLETIRTGPSFDAAVLDMSLPDIDGPGLLAEIFVLAPELPVLIASGSPVSHGDLEIAPGRKTAILQKPYPPRALIEALDNLLTS
jgi:CheY-like chemotaxis protein